MKQSTIKLLSIEFLLMFFLLLNIFVINIKNIYLLALLLCVFSIFVVAFLGYEKNRQRFKKDIVLNIIISTFIYYIALYLFGIYTGFIKNGYSLTFSSILLNVIPILLIIVCSEFLRYCLNVKGQKQKVVLALSIFLFVLIDVSLQIHLYHLQSKKELFELISYVVLPSVSKNILLTYFSIKFGYGSCILFRSIMEIPVYVIPIFPDINIYLNAIINFIFPIILFLINYRNFEATNNLENVRKHNMVAKIVSGVVIVFFIVIIVLTSGVFSIYALVVGSGSMRPAICKGDVVLIKKMNQKQLKELEEKDVLAFRYDKKVVVHRIVEIHKADNNYTFKTKGDYNKSVDEWIIDEKKVIGKVVLKIPYVGYPTVWLNEAMN